MRRWHRIEVELFKIKNTEGSFVFRASCENGKSDLIGTRRLNTGAALFCFIIALGPTGLGQVNKIPACSLVAISYRPCTATSAGIYHKVHDQARLVSVLVWP